jgi:hypothetical protein
MLGLPSRPDAVGAAMLVLGVVLGVTAALVVWRGPLRGWERLPAATLAIALGVTVAYVPFGAWRIVEDLRFTTGLNDEQVEGAGPIQTFIPPYVLDAVPALLPVGDTYVAVAGPRLPEEVARTAFPYLALTRLFPRTAVADPRRADWVIAWGRDPRSLGVPVEDVRVVWPGQANLPPVLLARVA